MGAVVQSLVVVALAQTEVDALLKPDGRVLVDVVHQRVAVAVGLSPVGFHQFGVGAIHCQLAVEVAVVGEVSGLLLAREGGRSDAFHVFSGFLVVAGGVILARQKQAALGDEAVLGCDVGHVDADTGIFQGRVVHVFLVFIEQSVGS